MTCLCRDCDKIPKVANAGEVLEQDGELVQVMHEGSKVVAGGYYGDWMARIIENLRGHHEPQEEYVFKQILDHVRPGSLIVELGAFWSYYSNWYLGAVPESKAVCLEPDANHLNCGRRNLALNGREALLINACIGGQNLPSVSIERESDRRTVEVPSYNMKGLLNLLERQPIELLHVDAQGAEYPFLRSICDTESQGLVRFIVISTHHDSISGSTTTHQDCLHLVREMGGVILAEHAVEQSFSGDGLIAASFSPQDRSIFISDCSVNRAEDSLFGPKPNSATLEVAQTQYGPMVVSSRDQVISRMLLGQQKFEECKITEVAGFLAAKHSFVPRTFFDIGANIGTHLVAAVGSGRFCSGIAVEMEDNNFALLQANIAINRLNDRVRLFHAALSNQEGDLEMELSDGNFGDHRIRVLHAQATGSFNEHARDTRKIESKTLDELVGSECLVVGSDTLIWIDTQGHEGQVLSGGRKTLCGARAPYVVCEVWPYGLERANGRQQLFEFLECCRAVYDINAENWTDLHPLTPGEAVSLYDGMLASADGHLRHTDFLCIPAKTCLFDVSSG